jgi:hypothetical protein
MYSNCRQPNRPALLTLTPGSVLLFGSNRGGDFVIDTVFVVRDSHPFSPVEPPETDAAFRVCTVEAIRTSDAYASNRFTLYRGATYDAPVEEMYSFVPCRRADEGNARFPRPVISLPSCYLNPLAQGPKGAGKARALSDVHAQWESVRTQVVAAGCLIGVHFSTPDFDNGSAAPARS